MHALTRTVLSHRRAVVVIWLLLAMAGAATARTTIGRAMTSYTLAGSPGYAANQRIATLYGNGGAAAPTVAVITLPASLRIDSRGVAAEAWPGLRRRARRAARQDRRLRDHRQPRLRHRRRGAARSR